MCLENLKFHAKELLNTSVLDVDDKTDYDHKISMAETELEITSIIVFLIDNQ